MTTLTIHLDNKKDVKLVEYLVKSLNGTIIKKEEAKSPYNPEFVAKIKRGEKEFKEGKGIVLDIDDFKKQFNI